MDAVLEASTRWGMNGPVQTLGPLIHNPQALEQLARRGVKQTNSSDQVDHGTVVVRAHGIPVHELRDLKERHRRKDLHLINGTCPEVAKVQARIKRYASKGYFIVLLGTQGHAETIAHESYASEGCAVVGNILEAENLALDPQGKVLVIAQTTFLVPDFEKIADLIRSNVQRCVVINSICKDTWKRQEEAEELCSHADYLVVIGGKSSNNTRHLADLARKAEKPFQWVESAEDLDLEIISDAGEVGVLAGASTPTWTVDDVVERLEEAGRLPWSRAAIRMMVALQIPVALGTGLLTAILHHLLGWSPGWAGPMLPAAFHLYVSALLPYFEPSGIGGIGQARGRFLARNRPKILAVGWVAGAVALVAAAHLGVRPAVGTLVLALVLIGVIRFRIGVLKAVRGIPAVVDLGWALIPVWLAVILPMFTRPTPDPTRLIFASWILFSLGLATHALRHLNAFRADQILGREILAVAVGSQATKWISILLVVGGIATLSAMAGLP